MLLLSMCYVKVVFAGSSWTFYIILFFVNFYSLLFRWMTIFLYGVLLLSCYVKIVTIKLSIWACHFLVVKWFSYVFLILKVHLHWTQSNQNLTILTICKKFQPTANFLNDCLPSLTQNYCWMFGLFWASDISNHLQRLPTCVSRPV